MGESDFILQVFLLLLLLWTIMPKADDNVIKAKDAMTTLYNLFKSNCILSIKQPSLRHISGHTPSDLMKEPLYELVEYT